MPIFIAALIGGLVTAASSIVGRVLIALAIGYVTYQGIDVLMTSIKDHVFSGLMGLPSVFMDVMAVLKIGNAINVLFSAFTARFVLQGLTGGKITKMVIK